MKSGESWCMGTRWVGNDDAEIGLGFGEGDRARASEGCMKEVWKDMGFVSIPRERKVKGRRERGYMGCSLSWNPQYYTWHDTPPCRIADTPWTCVCTFGQRIRPPWGQLKVTPRQRASLRTTLFPDMIRGYTFRICTHTDNWKLVNYPHALI